MSWLFPCLLYFREMDACARSEQQAASSLIYSCEIVHKLKWMEMEIEERRVSEKKTIEKKNDYS